MRGAATSHGSGQAPPRRRHPVRRAPHDDAADAAHAVGHPAVDWVVVGSGFGGSVAALRLAEKGYAVLVLEQGRRFRDQDFARDASQTRDLLWAPRLGLRGILQITSFRHVTVLSGVGVGGGSLAYANTLYVPRSDAFYRHPRWDGLADWRAELAPHYATASRMLGVTEHDLDGPSERLMRGLAADLGVQAHRTPVGVFLGEPGVRVPDPYFGGTGPSRSGCVRCGQCMLGCRHDAKNTLEKNYLWFAERAGARIRPGRRVVDVRPAQDGPGYVVAHRAAWGLDPRVARVRARGVVVAGGTLGTNTLLRRCRDRGSLPGLSDRLGHDVRTNSESITAVTAHDPAADYGEGLAIASSVFPDEDTHMTDNTYGAGGDRMALAFGPLVGGRSRMRRTLGALGAVARDPGRWLGPGRTRDWSRRTVIFTTMQSTDGALRLVGRRGRMRTVRDDRTPLEPHLEVADRATRLAAARMGGTPQASVLQAIRDAPTTAHFLGGATIGADARAGVVDADLRAFGHEDLLICDGSVVPANPGVNPSLTITALAERAMARIPAAAPGRWGNEIAAGAPRR